MSNDTPEYKPDVFVHMSNLRSAQDAGDEPTKLPGETGTSDAAGPVDPEGAADAFDASVLDGNVDAVRSALDGAELSDDDRKALVKAEKAGKNRKGVLDALNG